MYRGTRRPWLLGAVTTPPGFSRDYLVDDLAGDIGQAEVSALEAVGEAFVVEPEGGCVDFKGAPWPGLGQVGLVLAGGHVFGAEGDEILTPVSTMLPAAIRGVDLKHDLACVGVGVEPDRYRELISFDDGVGGILVKNCCLNASSASMVQTLDAGTGGCWSVQGHGVSAPGH